MITTTKPRPAPPAAADAPHNADVERAVLGVVLDGRQADAWGRLRERCSGASAFYVRDHRLIALVIERLAADGHPINAQSVAEAATRVRYHDAVDELSAIDGEKPGRVRVDDSIAHEDSLVAGIGGFNAIADLAAAYAPVSGFERNCDLLDEYHRRRRALREIDAARALISRGAVQADSVADDLAGRLGEVFGRGRLTATLGDAAAAVIADHDQAQESGVGRARGAWGLDALDARLPLKGGRMITLAGDPGGGKTSLALSAILATARKLGRGSVAMIPLEQDGRELVSILIARELGVRKDNLEQGFLTAEQRQAADDIRSELAALDVYVRDSSGQSRVTDIVGWVHHRQRRSGGALHLVVLDHVGLVDPAHARENEYQIVSAASKAMKALTRRGLCVLNVAQLNREGRKAGRDREGLVQAKPEPRMEDLRGSGSLEQDSDGVLFLWCRSDPKAPSRDVDLLCLKNRDGGGFALNATFHAANGQRFTLRHAVTDTDQRVAAAERVDKIDRDPGDAEDLFRDR